MNGGSKLFTLHLKLHVVYMNGGSKFFTLHSSLFTLKKLFT